MLLLIKCLAIAGIKSNPFLLSANLATVIRLIHLFKLLLVLENLVNFLISIPFGI